MTTDLDTTGPPSEGLLSFYDGLRRRVERRLARRGRLGATAADALLLVPDVFMLLARLALDRDVPKASRRLIGGALLYFVTPIDLLPEALVGTMGYLDDLVLASSILAHALGPDLEGHAARHWSGRGAVAERLRDVLHAAEALLGPGLWHRLRELLERRGVRVPEES